MSHLHKCFKPFILAILLLTLLLTTSRLMAQSSSSEMPFGYTSPNGANSSPSFERLQTNTAFVQGNYAYMGEEPASPKYISFTPQLTVTDVVGEVGVPDECQPNGTPGGSGLTGWDIEDVSLRYVRDDGTVQDRLYVSVRMGNDVIAGDADNDGSGSTTAPCLTADGGLDLPNLGGTEGIDLIFDTDLDGDYEAIAGIPQGDDITGLVVRTYNGDATPGTDIGLGYSAIGTAAGTANANNPNPSNPNFEYEITGFSTLFSGSSQDTLSFCFIARAGSLADAGFGEDIFPQTSCQDVSFEAEYDYGDLPGDTYETNATAARHIIDGATFLGAGVDAETARISDTSALGDDENGTDDEDGVTFMTTLVANGQATLEVEASTNGFLSAWIDGNANGFFTNNAVPAGERILTNHSLIPGPNVVNFTVPGTMVTETVYARFRFTSYELAGAALSPTGTLFDGEVEDYALMSLGDFVWRDNGFNPITPTMNLKNDGIYTRQVISTTIHSITNGVIISQTQWISPTGEVGIPNVRMELYRGTTLMGNTLTNGNGRYYFYGLQPGDYRVRVRYSNFFANGPLRYDDTDDTDVMMISSLGSGDPNNIISEFFTTDTVNGNTPIYGVDGDENGLDNAAPAVNGVRSGFLALTLGDEPAWPPLDNRGNSNRTLDFGFVPFTPTLELRKTVYLGDDNGAECFTGASDDDLIPVGTAGTTVTYCFEVTNRSHDVWLENITIDDPALGIDQNDMTAAINNSMLLMPTGRNFYYYVTTITEDLDNTATAEGQPATQNGANLLGLPDVTDTDQASVELVDPDVELQKTVYYGHDDGASCPGYERVSNINGADITYCFEMTNTGDTHLDDFTLTDTPLDVTLADLVLGSGATPLAPGDSIVFYYQSEISGTLTNSATITAQPTDADGAAYPGIGTETDTDTAQVVETTPSVQIQKTVYQGHDNGQSCEGSEEIAVLNGANVTYCFKVTNTSSGNHLEISILDGPLGNITDDNMELLSGDLPLPPNGEAVYYYETTINGDLINTATVTGNPVDSDNNDLANVGDVNSSDTAEVTVIQNGPVLALVPPIVTTGIGQTFEVTIEVQANSQQVDGASAYLDFDPALMQVASITPGSEFEGVIQNEFSNTIGTVDYSAGTFSDFPSGTFTLATVTFTATAQTDGSPIAFNSTGLRQSDVTFDSYSVLVQTVGNTVVIYNAGLECSVGLEGRDNAPKPHPRWSVPLDVSLTIPGESVPSDTFTPTTDENGIFTIGGLESGTYELRVKKSTTLQNMQTVTLVSGSNSADCGTLREGDANNDNMINIRDFSTLASTFSKCEDTDYDQRADFNGDGCITILDFSLLASNFAQAGEQPWPWPSTHSPAPSQTKGTGDVEFVIEPAVTTVEPGELFQVTVQLEASDQQVDGAQVMLNFDPEVLEVQEVTTGDKLELELANQFDNQQGTIFFAAGTLEEYPEGTFEIVQIEFRALEAGETALAFDVTADGATGSDVTFGGASVMGDHADGMITVSSEPTAITVRSLTSATPSPLWALAPLAFTMLAGIWLARKR